MSARGADQPATRSEGFSHMTLTPIGDRLRIAYNGLRGESKTNVGLKLCLGTGFVVIIFLVVFQGQRSFELKRLGIAVACGGLALFPGVRPLLFGRVRLDLDIAEGISEIGPPSFFRRRRLGVPKAVHFGVVVVVPAQYPRRGEISRLWQVRADSATGALIASQDRAEVEMRALARAISRFYRVPFVCPTPSFGEVKVAQEDVHLPYAKLAAKYLSVRAAGRHRPNEVTVEEDGRNVSYQYRPRPPAPFVTFLLILVMLAPIAIGAPTMCATEGRGESAGRRTSGRVGSIGDILWETSATALLALCGFWAFYRRACVGLSNDTVCLEAWFCVRYYSVSIPVAEIDEVRPEEGVLHVVSPRQHGSLWLGHRLDSNASVYVAAELTRQIAERERVRAADG